MIRLAHIADLHLGSQARLTHDRDLGPLFEAGFEAALNHLSTGAHDLVVLAGDLVDRNAEGTRWIADLQRLFDVVHETGARAVVVDGNHDARIGIRDHLRLGHEVVWFDAAKPRTVLWPERGVALHGCSVAVDGDDRDVLGRFPPATPYIDIGILHTSLEGDWSRRSCLPARIADLAERRYNYWALGHVHEHRIVCAEPMAAYAGSTWPLRLRDTGPHGVLDVTIDGDRVDGHLIETAPLRLENLTLDADITPEQAVAALNGLRSAVATSPAHTIVVKAARSLPDPVLTALIESVKNVPRFTVLPC